MATNILGPQKRRRPRRSITPPPLLFLATVLSACHHAPCSALYVEQLSPPPASSSSPPIANVGGTVPERVIAEYAEYDRYGNNPKRDGLRGVGGGDSFFWLDNLGTESSSLASERWHRRRKEPVSSQRLRRRRPFSLLSWNILSQTLYEANLESQRQCQRRSESTFFPWHLRLQWILDTLTRADADLVCLQEVQYELFHTDIMPAMQRRGYDGTVQGSPDVREIKRRSGKERRKHVVSTFWKRRRFRPVNVAVSNDGKEHYAHMARGRTLTCVLQDVSGEEDGEKDGEEEEGTDDETKPPPPPPPTLAVINCHLEGHPRQYAARIQQLHHAMDDLAKRRTPTTSDQPTSPSTPVSLHGLAIAGDFNCELQSSACSTYLRIGRVGKKGGLGGVHGTSALAMPTSVLSSQEAAEILHPIIEWGHALPDEDMENVKPHPFRRNSMVSAYPVQLGQRDAREHFTYCANPYRPVAGLDQIWHSGLSLTRVGLRKMFPTQWERESALETGLPSAQTRSPSDHLPIGAVFDWNTCDPPVDECALDDPTCRSCSDSGVRELYVTVDQPPRRTPRPKSPIMAYAELDILLSTCPYDSEAQRREIESIVDHVPDLPPDNQKPSTEQLAKLREMRERKKVLLMDASESARQVLQRILKLKKEVAGY